MNKSAYIKQEATLRTIPNVWDILALLIVLLVIFIVGIGAKSMIGQYHLGQKLPIDLSVGSLPYYALRTFLRLVIALMFSLLFTFVVGTWAAKLIFCSQYRLWVIFPLFLFHSWFFFAAVYWDLSAQQFLLFLQLKYGT